MQELERLQATDPEAAKEKLEEMEKVNTTSDRFQHHELNTGENWRKGFFEAQERFEISAATSEESKVRQNLKE